MATLSSGTKQETEVNKMSAEITTKDKKEKVLLQSCLVGLFLIIFAFTVLCFPNLFKEETPVSAEFSAVDKICELATLKCYYHNVLEDEKQPDGLFKYGLFQYGYKKFWMEYDGIVKIGVDVSEVVINKPDENNIVQIYVPEAKILDVDVVVESMSELIADTGVLTTITMDDQAKAFSHAQENMRECAESDANILNAARRNAKEVLKQYVINVGKQMGQNYTVEWIDSVPTK